MYDEVQDSNETAVYEWFIFIIPRLWLINPNTRLKYKIYFKAPIILGEIIHVGKNVLS